MEKECNVLVVGGGGSGLVAAVRAAQLGAGKVIVLERAKRTGGGMMMASAMRTFGSKWQKERNIPDVTNEYLRGVMDSTYWRLNPALAENAIRATGQFFDWFCELADEADVNRFHEGLYVFEHGDGPIGPQLGGGGNPIGSGRVFMDTMRSNCDTFGVEVLTEHRAVRSVVENGRIVKVVAEGPDGEVTIQCDTCIIACGSWINNEEVVKRCFPEFAEAKVHMGVSPHTNPNYCGDGFKLVDGLDTEADEKNFTLRLMGPMVMIRNQTLTSMSNSSFCIAVNRNGKRFMCESSQFRMGIFNSGLVQMEQPEGLAYIIFDSNNLDAAVKDFVDHPPTGDYGVFGPPSFPLSLAEAQADIQKELDSGSKKVVSAATLAELAELLGLEPDALLAEVERYNGYCEKSFDSECFKESRYLVPLNQGPYYALKTDLGTDGAFGGVLVNEKMQALHKDGTPVDGLYVTGDFSSGRFINMGGVKVQLLNDMSWALASGFIAGTEAASK